MRRGQEQRCEAISEVNNIPEETELNLYNPPSLLIEQKEGRLGVESSMNNEVGEIEGVHNRDPRISERESR